MDYQIGDFGEFAERRAALRQRCRVETLSVEHDDAGIMTAIVLDLSRDGFRLLLPRPVPCGDEIVLHPPEGAGLLKIRATVVWESLAMHNDVRMIACGAEVGETADWRKHNWFLALRKGIETHAAAA